MTPFEKRLAAAEAKVIPKVEAMRVLIPPSGCPDIAAWEAESLGCEPNQAVAGFVVL